MSLITRCPACFTMFKVVADQLRISEGWVRCGQCDEVFDANANFVSDGAGAVTGTADTPAPPVPSRDAPTEADEITPDVSDAVAMVEHSSSAQPPDLEAGPSVPEFESPAESLKPIPALDTFLSMSPSELAALEHTDQHNDLRDSLKGRSEPGLDAAAWDHDEITMDGDSPYTMRGVTAEPVESVAVKAPSFMRAKTPASRWHKPAVRGLLGLLAVVLAGALLAQIAAQERDRIAASIPDLRPAIVSLCDALGCKVEPVRQIDAIVIDSSAFVPVRVEVYRLNVTLKNKSRIDVAVPALELTLTDLQDQTLLRKVLNAAELGAPGGTIAAGAEFVANVPVSVKPEALTQPIRGYRVLAFYP